MLPSDQLRYITELQSHPAWAQILAPWLSQQIQTAYKQAVYGATPEERETARHTVMNLEQVINRPQILIKSAYEQTAPPPANPIPQPTPVATADGGIPDITRLGESLVAQYTRQIQADLSTPTTPAHP